VIIDFTPSAAASVALYRRAVRKSLLEWARHCGFEPAAHHRLLIEKLEAVANGSTRNLAVFMPPGSAKSTYCSILFPVWYFANHPDRSIVAASHTLELGEKWGRRNRNLVAEHSHTLGIELSSDSQAAGRWSLSTKGEYLAAGVGSAITGYRADLGIIDDPVKSREDADSKIMRDRAWEWYQSDFRTRLKPSGSTILIQTRWHEDDLAGRILAEMERGYDQWEIISLPAEALEGDALGRAPGEMLWGDDTYGYAKHLQHEKETQPPRNWAALFQQNPVPDTGKYFEEGWLKPYTETPPLENLHIYGASDFAVTSDGGDYTVHLVVGVDQNNKMFLLDLWRKRTSTDKWIDAWCDLVIRWKPLEWGTEAGQIKSSIGPFIERRARERRVYTYTRTFPSKHDKSVRAQSIRGRMALNGLYVPVHAHWYGEFLSECLSFPMGKHDDQVDCLSLIGQMIDHIVPGCIAAKPAPIKLLIGPSDGSPFNPVTLEDLWEISDAKRYQIGRRI
jgi:predicted phage terminase large subunit-like protein